MRKLGLVLVLLLSLPACRRVHAKDPKAELETIRKSAEKAAKENSDDAVKENNKLLKALWERGVEVKSVHVEKKWYLRLSVAERDFVVMVSEEAKGDLFLVVCRLTEKLMKRWEEASKIGHKGSK